MIDAVSRRDVITGIGSALLITFIGLAAVPVYVRLLGIEAYGLVGFLALLQGMLQLLDLGFAPTVSREVARARAVGELDSVRQLLFSLSIIYWAVAALILVVGIVAAPAIATYWLAPQHMSVDTVSRAVMLMSVIIALRWPIGIYMGAAIGARRLTRVSLLNLGAVILANGAGVVAVWQSRRIEVLFAVQAVVAAGLVFAFHQAAWQSVGRIHGAAWSIKPLRAIWRFSAGMGAITLIAVAFLQLDKLLVSRLLPLQAFGLYALANVIGRALYGLINPIYNVIHPRFSAMVASGEFEKLEVSYLVWTGMFCAVFFPASMMVAAGALPLLKIWMGDSSVAAGTAPLVSLIAAGSAIHGAMYFPFALQVGIGDSRTPLLINSIILAAYVPILISFIVWKGVLGAALAWPVTMTLYAIVGTIITHRIALRAVAAKWVIQEVGISLLICLFIGAVLYVSVTYLVLGPWVGLGLVVIGTVVAALACLALLLLRHPALLASLRDEIALRSQAAQG
jgi:O-antigen/teichoic acid export membrane protein